MKNCFQKDVKIFENNFNILVIFHNQLDKYNEQKLNNNNYDKDNDR